MILPERVLGSSGTTVIWRGLAIGEMSVETCERSSAIRVSPVFSAPSRRITNATMP